MIRMSHPEDICICIHNREYLQQQHGIRFAPPELAEHFAYERLPPTGPTFGFHGLFNLPRELPRTELLAFLKAMPDRLARSLDAHDLCRLLIADGALGEAAELLAKRRRMQMRDRRTLRLKLQFALASLRRLSSNAFSKTS
jgi:hypothetical protein